MSSHSSRLIRSRRLRAELKDGLAIDIRTKNHRRQRIVIASVDCRDHGWHSGAVSLIFRRSRLKSGSGSLEIVSLQDPLPALQAVVCGQKPEQLDLEATTIGDQTSQALFDSLLDLCGDLDLPPVLTTSVDNPADGVSVYAPEDITIDDNQPLIQSVVSAALPTSFDHQGELFVFRDCFGRTDNFALRIGRPDPQATPVRIHSSCLTGDLLASLRCDCGEQLQSALAQFASVGGGVLLYLSQEGRGIGLYNKIIAYRYQQQGSNTIDANLLSGHKHDLRSFKLAAAMLKWLQLPKVILITNNPEKAAAMQDHGIQVIRTEASVSTGNPHNLRYLQTKRDQMGHRTVVGR